MPVLDVERPTIKVKLPVSKAQVELYEFLLAGEEKDIQRAYLKHGRMVPGQSGATVLSEIKADATIDLKELVVKKFVASWDFTDSEGNPIEPTIEALRRLHRDDYAVIEEQVDLLQGSPKKAKT